jgi:hypothetical protein
MADLDSLRIDLDHCNWLIDLSLDHHNEAAFRQHAWRRQQLLRQLQEASGLAAVDARIGLS